MGAKHYAIYAHTYIVPSGRSSIAYLRFSTAQLLQSALMLPSDDFVLRYVETQVGVPMQSV